MSSWKEIWADLFKFKGRLGRERYGRHLNKILLPYLILMLLNFLIFDAFEVSERLPHLASVVDTLLTIFFWIFLICLIFFSTRRLHDMNHSGLWTWLLIIIVFSNNEWSLILAIIFGMWLGNKSGTDGENKYGEPPED